MIPAIPDELNETPDLRRIEAATAEAGPYLEELIRDDPAAVAELRRLLLEGLEGIEDTAVEADDDWLESLGKGIRARAAARAAGRT